MFSQRTKDLSRVLFRSNHAVTIALLCLITMLLAAYFAPFPYDPLATDASRSLQGPNAEHLFGTDRSGGDVFSRTVQAARYDLPLAILGTGLALVFGVTLGLAASTKGRWGERMMRILDGFQAFPTLVLALALVSLSGNRIEMVAVAIAVINVPQYMRLIRSEVLSLREKRFVEAARASGATTTRIMMRHIPPNIRAIVLAQTSLTAANSILLVASLSFLGVGITPPTPSWGRMIRDGSQNLISGQWWMAIFPGLAVFVAVLCFNAIAQSAGGRRVIR